MPRELAELFVRFLTDKGDVVLDPFAGSNTTGVVAEDLGRWLSCDANWDYATSSIACFSPDRIIRTRDDLIIEKIGQAASSTSSVVTPLLTS
jgi:hypothetical protein